MATDPPTVTKKGLDIINHIFPHDTFSVRNLRTQLTHNEFFTRNLVWGGELVLDPVHGVIRSRDDDE